MRLQQYLQEEYTMYFKKEFHDGTEYSDHEYFKNKADAAKTLQAYKINIDTDVKNLYYWDDEGNSVTLVWNGKIVSKRVTKKMLESQQYVNELSLKKDIDVTYNYQAKVFRAQIVILDSGLEQPDGMDVYFNVKATKDLYEVGDDISAQNSLAQYIPEDVINKKIREDNKYYAKAPAVHAGKLDSVYIWDFSFSDMSYNYFSDYALPQSSKYVFSLFAALEQILREFIKHYKVQLLTYNADRREGSKIKLYESMAKRISAGAKFNYRKVNHNGLPWWIFWPK